MCLPHTDSGHEVTAHVASVHGDQYIIMDVTNWAMKSTTGGACSKKFAHHIREIFLFGILEGVPQITGIEGIKHHKLFIRKCRWNHSLFPVIKHTTLCMLGNVYKQHDL